MISPQHLLEWRNSCVDQEIVELNVRSLQGSTAYSHLLYSERLPRTNPGVLARDILRRYSFLDNTDGWWCNGVDPLNNGEPMLWGCFKPRHPRIDFEKCKPIKYEHPLKIETRVFLLSVPDHIWQKVSDRYGIPISDDDRERGFWHWVWKYNAPIVITEGAKKAGALLTAGFAALALPGIDGGYRTPKDEEGNRIGGSYLIPDLKHFATLGREVFICFDRDSKQRTIRAVNKAVATTGLLLCQSGCNVRVVTWQQPEKGIDDFIAAHGTNALEEVFKFAQPLDVWQASSFTQLTYPAAIKVNRRYLGDISIPDDAKLVALRSAKGTGKTQLLESIVSDATASGKRVLVVGHRVQLVEALCHRFGIPYITSVRSSEFGDVLGYGLCIDSLHPKSQARFNADNWHNSVVILDECEQVIWHALNSSTCQNERISILRQLKALLHNVLQGSGRVFLADADLSDLSVDFVRSLSGANVEPYVLLNKWRSGPGECWDVYNYEGNPSGLVDALEKHIADGGRPFVVCSAQKVRSKWGTRTLDSHFRKLFPSKRILRIDSETIADPSHPAYGCIARLNNILQRYDIVIASPSVETGVSLDLKGHFTSVWGIFQGVQAESSARQALSRLREPVPRHIWVASHGGIGMIGNGSTNRNSLLASQYKLTKANIRLLKESAFEDIELNFQPESFQTWACMAVRINLGMVNYRQSILEGLKAEGHQIIEMGKAVSDSVQTAIANTRDENHRAEAEAIAASPDLTSKEFEQLQDKTAKTQSERHKERKHTLALRYSIPVDADLVIKDDNGWYPQLRLHYFLSVGREFLPMRDLKRLRSATEQGQGAIWQPDLNKGQMSAAVAAMERLGVLDLLTLKEVRATDAAVQRTANVALNHSRDIKTALNITISEKDTPIAIAQKLLGKLGLKLSCLRREGSDGNRQRVYGYTPPDDGRDEVFAAWIERDEVAAMAVDFTSTPGNKEVSTTSPMDANSLKVTPVLQAHQTHVATSTPGNKENTNSPVDVTNLDVETPLLQSVLVRCWKFGRDFLFRFQRLIDNTTAEIKSVLTEELFQVPASTLALWESSA